VRDELLGVELFESLTEAQVMVADWREDYNHHRPHSSLGMTAPVSFAQAWRQSRQNAKGITRGTSAQARTTPHNAPIPDHDGPIGPNQGKEADQAALAVCRVAGAVARPGSHGTVLALFAHGSSGRRVANPAAGRVSTSTYPQSSTSWGWTGATMSLREWRCRSTRRVKPCAVKYFTGMALSTAGLWLSAHVDLCPA
jgi:hypothetical protein